MKKRGPHSPFTLVGVGGARAVRGVAVAVVLAHVVEHEGHREGHERAQHQRAPDLEQLHSAQGKAVRRALGGSWQRMTTVCVLLICLYVCLFVLPH